MYLVRYTTNHCIQKPLKTRSKFLQTGSYGWECSCRLEPPWGALVYPAGLALKPDGRVVVVMGQIET